jgi:hypothetical protein
MGFVGAENCTALMVNLGNGETFALEIMSTRWGPGLGGSVGAVFVLGFGFIEPYVLHGENMNDWGVNVAFTEKLITKGAIQGLMQSRRLYDIYKDFKAMDVMKARHIKSAFKDMDMLASVRNAFHTIYQGFESSKRSGIVVIDVPYAGIGLELSVHVLRGHMAVSNSSDMDLGG